ncbi:MAG: ABC transporter substrate-binding protein [Candidatus Binatia bacterium]
MRVFFKTLLLLLAQWAWVWSLDCFAATSDPAPPAMKQQAETKGYASFANRDEIVAKAKQEGKLRVAAEIEAPTIKATTAAFKKKYPFIDLYVEETTGTEAMQRRFLALKSGMAKEWDVISVSTELYDEIVAHLWRVDLFGLASGGVLAIPPQMIDPKNRNVMAFFSRFQVTAYNKQLLPAGQVPKTWEDFLKPEFKGKKFAADVRPSEIAYLVPAWGLEKTLAFARKIAAQQPIWVRGGSRTLTAMIAGEIPLFIGPNFHTVKRAQSKDRAGRLQYVVLEPVPLRLAGQVGIQAGVQHPHAALLWLEWMASPEAQRLIDEHEPLASSVYVRGGFVERELVGKELSLLGWEDRAKAGDWEKKIFEAYGFPRAERK